MANRKVVFIIGTGHCGSTLLDLILGSHKSAFNLGELASLLYRNEIGAQHSVERICGICPEHCDFWDRHASTFVMQRYFSNNRRFGSVIRKISYFHRSIYDYLFKWTDANLLIDSSKKTWWVKRQLHFQHHWRKTQPVLIYVQRDGRAVVNSFLRKYPERGIRDITRDWKRRVNQLNEFYANFSSSQRTIIRYEDLATSPNSVISELCSFLHIPYRPDMLHFWTHEHHIISGNAGTRSMIMRYRDTQGLNSSYSKESLSEVNRLHNDYYEQLGLAIQLDLRWQQELSQEDLQTFESIAGEINTPFAYSS